jgi:hypothetical protein
LLLIANKCHKLASQITSSSTTKYGERLSKCHHLNQS